MFNKGIAALSIVLAHALLPCWGDEVSDFLAEVRTLQGHFKFPGYIGIRRVDGNWRFAEIPEYTPFRLGGIDKELVADAIRGPVFRDEGGEIVGQLVAIGHQKTIGLDASRRIVFQQVVNQMKSLEELRVSCDGSRNDVEDVAKTREHLLSFVSFLSEDTFRSLPAGRNLRSLSFANCSVNDSMVAAIAKLTCLQELSLDGNAAVSDIGIASLANATKLRRLDLHHVGYDGCTALSALAELRALRLNDLMSTKYAGGLSQLDNLRELEIDGATKLPAEKIALPKNLTRLGVGNLELVPFFDFSTCPNLTHIELQLNTSVARAIPPESLQQLGYLRNLTSICLFDASDINAFQLSTFTSLRNLKLVPACGSPLTGDAISALQAMRSLESLDIVVTQLSGNAVEALGKMPNLHHLRLTILQRVSGSELGGLSQLKALRTLHLRHSPVSASDGWAETLFSESSQLRQINDLQLTANLTNDQLISLARFSSLRKLDVNCDSENSDRSFAELMRRLPKLEYVVRHYRP